MNKFSILAFILLVALSQADDCTVTLPRLLLGDRYYTPLSNVTALILFDTVDLCKDLPILNFGVNATTFKYTVGEPVPQEVDAVLSHNNKSSELVQYKKWTQVIKVHSLVETAYTIQIQGNKTDTSTVFANNYTFTLPKLIANNTNYTQNGFKFMFFGDQDLTPNGTAVLNYLHKNKDDHKFDAMVFLGDYAYEFYQSNGQRGDQYVAELAPLSFNYPMAWTPGNHEDNVNFTLFNEKFFLPGFSASNLNNYNSFTIGMVHFVHINLHFYSITDPAEQNKMLLWLKKDLSAASQAATRRLVPWIIAVGHKLTYCYDPYYANNAECVGYAQQFYAVDRLLSDYGVDLFVVGHQHYNQIMAPMARNQLMSYKMTNISASEHVVQKGQGYMTIVQGNGGCFSPAIPQNSSRRMLSLQSDLQEASLFLDEIHYGYGYITVKNQTALEYISVDAINDRQLVNFTIFSQHLVYSFGMLASFSLFSVLALLITLF